MKKDSALDAKFWIKHNFEIHRSHWARVGGEQLKYLDVLLSFKYTKQLRIIIAVIKDALAHRSAIRLIHDN